MPKKKSAGVFEELGKLGDQQEKIREQQRALALKEIKPALQAAFNDVKKFIPEAIALKWHQYTPYFNDGEECTFSLHGVYIKLEGSEKEGDNEDGWCDSYSLPDNLTPKQKEVFEEFDSNLNDIEELLQVALGDHVEVILTSKGIEAESYEHE
jgi:hypothetical protein